jgi:hypothetical protein
MSEKVITPKTKEEAAKTVSDQVVESAAELHKIYEPQWNARADVLKTIVSLSSASIVLSVTFSSMLRSLNVDLFWRYLIVFSFSMLVISLILAFIALRVGTRLYEVQSNMVERKQEIKKAVMDASSEEEFYKTFQDILNRSFKLIARNDKLANQLFRISSACFCLAIISLAVVGAVQLLS